MLVQWKGTSVASLSMCLVCLPLAFTAMFVVCSAVYPMQTGKQRAALIARHRAPLLALAVALTDCCNALGDVFVQNTGIRSAGLMWWGIRQQCMGNAMHWKQRMRQSCAHSNHL